MKGYLQLVPLFFLASLTRVQAQDVNFLQHASDPVSMHSRFTADIESFLFFNEAQFYSLRPGYYYGLENERLLLGMSIPVVHNVFNADYAGFENTTGFGDLRISALAVPYFKSGTLGLERVSVSLDVTAPTGEYRLGRGAGAWLYKPGMVFTWRPGPELAFYPEVRFQFSGGDANSRGGIDGMPDPEDPNKDARLQNLSVALPFVAQLEEWQGWFGLQAMYSRALVDKTDYVFLRTDFGKMIGERSSASLRISKFIAGQPRLNVTVQVNFTFFMR